jgi:uncharacterized BrkB/YihY/UPF0761 family membrane protein
MRFKRFLEFFLLFLLTLIPLIFGIITGLVVKLIHTWRAAFMEGYEFGAKW